MNKKITLTTIHQDELSIWIGDFQGLLCLKIGDTVAQFEHSEIQELIEILSEYYERLD